MAKTDDIRPTQDQHNANRGTARGRHLLEQSLRTLGAGRSVLLDRNGVAIAGNKTLEVATELGLTVRTIHTDGNELIAVVRDDLDLAQGGTARELAYADNRVSEISLDWDIDVIAQDRADGVDLSSWFFDDELDAILDSITPPPSLDDLANVHGDVEADQFWPTIQVKVDPDTYERWMSTMRLAPGTNDGERVAAILAAVDTAVLTDD